MYFENSGLDIKINKLTAWILLSTNMSPNTKKKQSTRAKLYFVGTC
jgi:hypothetical protein